MLNVKVGYKSHWFNEIDWPDFKFWTLGRITFISFYSFLLNFYRDAGCLYHKIKMQRYLSCLWICYDEIMVSLWCRRFMVKKNMRPFGGLLIFQKVFKKKQDSSFDEYALRFFSFSLFKFLSFVWNSTRIFCVAMEVILSYKLWTASCMESNLKTHTQKIESWNHKNASWSFFAFFSSL